MDRRDFLKAALLTGAAQTGCASVQERPAVEPLPDMEATLGKLDRDLARIDSEEVSRHFAGLGPPSLLPRLTFHDPLLRSSLKSLYLSGVFRDLPLEAQLHPGVQARMWAAAPDLDHAVLQMQSRLTSLSDASLREVHSAMRADPLLLPRVIASLDAASSSAEIPPERRLKMRSLMKTLGWRMQHQSPRAVIGEYLEKMQRLQSRGGSQAEQERRFAAGLTEAGFFEYRERVEAIALRWREHGAGAGGDGHQGRIYQGPGSSGIAVKVGLVMMGVGVLTFGVGLIFLLPNGMNSSAWGVGAGLTTAGGIIVLLGLLTTIIAAIVQAIVRTAYQDDPASWRSGEEEAPEPPPVHRPLDPSNLWRPH